MSSIIVYNPNSYYRQYLNETQFGLFHLLSKRTIFATTLEEIYQFIDPQELKLPKSTSNTNKRKRKKSSNIFFN